MNDEPAGDGDSADTPVPDRTGELEHTHRPTDAEGSGAQAHGRPDARTILSLAAIVAVLAAGVLWAVLARGPESGPRAATTTLPVRPDVEAAALYDQNCATCHGPGGTGIQGSGAPALAGAGLTPQAVADRVIEGSPGMPAYRSVLSDAEIAALSTYVSDLGRRR